MSGNKAQKELHLPWEFFSPGFAGQSAGVAEDVLQLPLYLETLWPQKGH